MHVISFPPPPCALGTSSGVRRCFQMGGGGGGGGLVTFHGGLTSLPKLGGSGHGGMHPQENLDI